MHSAEGTARAARLNSSPARVRALERRKENSRKSVRWSAVPVAPVSVCGCVMVRGAAAPKGPMTYAVLSFITVL